MLASDRSVYARYAPAAFWRRLVSHALLEGRPLTSRGTWANPIILAQLRLAARLIPPGPVDRPIFILGTGRSGTTILGDLLGSHRQVAFLNEPKAMWYVANPVDDVVGTYARGRGRYRLTASDVTESTASTIRSLYRYALVLCRASRIVDKYPEMIYRVEFLQSMFPDAKFIVIVRNGWDTIRSISAWSERNRRVTPEGKVDWWGVDRRKWKLLQRDILPSDPILSRAVPESSEPLSEESLAAIEWIATMREASRLESNGVSLSVVRYEQLAGDPDRALSALCAFAELPYDKGLYSFAGETLREPVRRGRPSLPEPLSTLVNQTMAEWGYPTRDG